MAAPLEAIVGQLTQQGIPATVDETGGQVLCISIEVGAHLFYFGTANETWGASIWSAKPNPEDDLIDPDEINTDCSTDEPDAVLVADAIRLAIADYERSYPQPGLAD